KVDAQTVIDGIEHRHELPSTYNGYARVSGDPLYYRPHEDLHSLLRGLFTTGFLIDDFLATHAFFGASTVVIASASSKTALGFAHQLVQRRGTVASVGLTSEANRAFVAGLGLYDRVLTYAQIEQLDPQRAAVFVDFAGSGPVRTAVHERYRDQLA